MKNASFINLATYFLCAELTAKMATELGYEDQAVHYREVAKKVRDAINQKWLSQKNGQTYYCNNHQSPNAMALHYGLVPDQNRLAVLRSLVKDIQDRGTHLDTGAIGTLSLIPALSSNGRNDMVWALTQQETPPSWMYMINQGPGTLWEHWQMRSRSQSHSKAHPFLGGSITTWMHQVVAGIRPGLPRYETVEIRPTLVGDLTYCKASIPTVRGIVSTHWTLNGKQFELTIFIPGNTDAEVYLPGTDFPKKVGPGSHRFLKQIN